MRTVVKILFCGSRDWTDEYKIRVKMMGLRTRYGEYMVIEGDAPGADRAAGAIADELGYPHIKVPANWSFYLKAAGPIRNRWMLDLAPVLVVAFHADLARSKGTKDCATEARRRGIQVEVVE